MGKKAQGRAAPRMNLIGVDDLGGTFAAQLETGAVSEAVVDGGPLPSLDAGRRAPVRIYRCLWRGVTAGDGKARGLRV